MLALLLQNLRWRPSLVAREAALAALHGGTIRRVSHICHRFSISCQALDGVETHVVVVGETTLHIVLKAPGTGQACQSLGSPRNAAC